MKKSFRQNALAYRQQLNADEIAAFSRQIAASVSTLLQTFSPCTVGLFYPMRGEPNILNIMGNPALKHFNWALPVCCESTTGALLQFADYRVGDALEVGKYKIEVPLTKNWVQPDVLLIPCVAFHKSGARLGYGAGWYDRTLQHMPNRPVAVGIAYADTEIPHNFAEHHDKLLDHVITETSVITCLGGDQ